VPSPKDGTSLIERVGVQLEFPGLVAVLATMPLSCDLVTRWFAWLGGVDQRQPDQTEQAQDF